VNAEEGCRILIAEMQTPLLPPGGIGEDVGEWLARALDALATKNLSNGERKLIGAVQAIWNGGGELRLADLSAFDHRRQQLVCSVWCLVYGTSSYEHGDERLPYQAVVERERRDRD
jgi:hypothetical protein